MGKKKKKAAPPKTGMDRLKKISLWQWGAIVIGSSIFSSVMTQFMAVEASSASERQAQAIGRLVACLLGIFVGSGMIIVHLVRSKKK
jgi:Na+/proline symporter